MTVYDLVKGDGPRVCGRITKMQGNGMLEEVLPELLALAKEGEYSHKDNFEHTIRVVGQAHDLSDGDPDIKVAALMHDLGKGPTARYSKGKGWTFHGHEAESIRITKRVFKRHKLPSDKCDLVCAIIHLAGRAKDVSQDVTDSAVRRFAKEAGNDRDLIAKALTFAAADITTKYVHKLMQFRKELADLHARVIEVLEADERAAWRMCVDAHDIMGHTGLTPGPVLGRVKNKLEDMVRSGELGDDREAILEMSIKLIDDEK